MACCAVFGVPAGVVWVSCVVCGVRFVSIWDVFSHLGCFAGAQAEDTVFLCTDKQVQDEACLEDLSNLLNSGEISNLYPPEDLDGLLEPLKAHAAEMGRDLSHAGLFAFFVERTRVHLHVVLCFSPAGPALRARLRKFPALVNCCTLDWYAAWPEEALSSVALYFLGGVSHEEPEMREKVVWMCQFMHRSIEALGPRFLAEMQMHVYVTPMSYLELIVTLKLLLEQKREEVSHLQNRYETGLAQLQMTEGEVDEVRSLSFPARLPPTLKRWGPPQSAGVM